MGNSKCKYLLCHMQIRTVGGRVIGLSTFEKNETITEMKKICYKSLRAAFDNIAKLYDLPLAMPEHILSSIENMDEEFDVYDTQVVIVEVLIHENSKAVQNRVHKKLQFKNTDVNIVRKIMKKEIERIEKECQDIMKFFGSQISLRIED